MIFNGTCFDLSYLALRIFDLLGRIKLSTLNNQDYVQSITGRNNKASGNRPADIGLGNMTLDFIIKPKIILPVVKIIILIKILIIFCKFNLKNFIFYLF